jgi:UDP:flavonoid glycosyltransferase YjiC (YdhE family)
MRERHFLLVCHDAGGTVPPQLALAEALVRSGHDVAILSQPSVRHRAEDAGCRFFAFSAVLDYEARKPLEEQVGPAVAICGRAVGDDLTKLGRHLKADVVVVDANLAGGLAAAEVLPQPSVVLLHSMYKTFVDVWFAELWPLLGPAINQTRADYGLGEVDSWLDVFKPHDLMVSVVPADFEAPVPRLPARMRHFGFLVPSDLARPAPAPYPDGGGPTVLVSLSTTYQRQERLLQAILDALGGLNVRGLAATAGQVDADALSVPPNVVLTDYISHAAVLGETDVVVTHGGLGSVAAALNAGVPLVCTPIGRDQPLNAEQVVRLGAGLNVGSDPTAARVTDAIEEVVSHPGYAQCARALSDASAQAGGPPALAAELQKLIA